MATYRYDQPQDIDKRDLSNTLSTYPPPAYPPPSAPPPYPTQQHAAASSGQPPNYSYQPQHQPGAPYDNQFAPAPYPPYTPQQQHQQHQQHQQQQLMMMGVQPMGSAPMIFARVTSGISMTGALILSCLVFWFCGWLFGGIAFALAMFGHRSAAAGDTRGAIHLRNASYGLSIVGIVVGIIIIIAITVTVRAGFARTTVHQPNCYYYGVFNTFYTCRYY